MFLVQFSLMQICFHNSHVNQDKIYSHTNVHGSFGEYLPDEDRK